jgi:hypothetical protein
MGHPLFVLLLWKSRFFRFTSFSVRMTRQISVTAQIDVQLHTFSVDGIHG